MDKYPRVGFGVYILKDGKILLGKRMNAHGDGTWCAPGGHLEFGESFEDGAKRETLEEAGIEISNIKVGAVTNDIFEKEGKHYVTISMLADYEFGEVSLMESDKWVEWNWFDKNNLPSPLFLSMENLLKKNFDPFKR